MSNLYKINFQAALETTVDKTSIKEAIEQVRQHIDNDDLIINLQVAVDTAFASKQLAQVTEGKSVELSANLNTRSVNEIENEIRRLSDTFMSIEHRFPDPSKIPNFSEGMDIPTAREQLRLFSKDVLAQLDTVIKLGNAFEEHFQLAGRDFDISGLPADIQEAFRDIGGIIADFNGVLDEVNVRFLKMANHAAKVDPSSLLEVLAVVKQLDEIQSRMDGSEGTQQGLAQRISEMSDTLRETEGLAGTALSHASNMDSHVNSIMEMVRDVAGLRPEFEAVAQTVNQILSGEVNVGHQQEAIGQITKALQEQAAAIAEIAKTAETAKRAKAIVPVTDSQMAKFANELDTIQSKLNEFKGGVTGSSDALQGSFNNADEAARQLSAALEELNNARGTDGQAVALERVKTALVNAKHLVGGFGKQFGEASKEAKAAALATERATKQATAAAEKAARAAAVAIERTAREAATAARNAAKEAAAVEIAPVSDSQMERFSNTLANVESNISRVRASISGTSWGHWGTVLQGSFNDAEEAARQLRNAFVDLHDAQGTDMQAEALERVKVAMASAKQLAGDFKQVTSDTQGIENMLRNTEKLAGELQKMEVDWSAFKADPALVATWQDLQQQVSAMNAELTEAFSEGDIARVATFTQEMKTVSAGVTTFKKQVGAADKQKKNFGDTIMATSKKLSAYIVSMFGFQRIIVLFRDALRYVQEIDRAMTALRRVTDETARTYERFLTEAYRRAQRLGTSVSAIINATADFARLGHNLADATMLGDAAAILNNVANVGTERLPMEDGVQGIISVMQAFGVEAQNAMHIVNSFNEVGL